MSQISKSQKSLHIGDYKTHIGVALFAICSIVYWVCLEFLYLRKKRKEDEENGHDERTRKARAHVRAVLYFVLYFVGSILSFIAYVILMPGKQVSTMSRRPGSQIKPNRGRLGG